jgi:hypothetical protein
VSITAIGGRMGSISTPDRRMRRGEILQASAMREHTRALAGRLQRWEVPLEAGYCFSRTSCKEAAGANGQRMMKPGLQAAQAAYWRLRVQTSLNCEPSSGVPPVM